MAHYRLRGPWPNATWRTLVGGLSNLQCRAYLEIVTGLLRNAMPSTRYASVAFLTSVSAQSHPSPIYRTVRRLAKSIILQCLLLFTVGHSIALTQLIGSLVIGSLHVLAL